MQVDNRSAILTGTPTAGGTYNFSITVTSGSNSITVNDQLNVFGLTSSSLPDANLSVAYSEQLQGAGGTGPYTFTTTDTLPPGLTLASDGTVSGTPTLLGSYSFVVKITDAGGLFCSTIVALEVTGAVVCSCCHWPDILANIVNPGGCTPSALPAWNGVFDLSTLWSGGTWPMYYFVGQSIAGLQTSADESGPLYPSGNWQDTQDFTQLSWFGGVWGLIIQCSSGSAMWLGLGSVDPLDASGEYTFLGGSSVGITRIRITKCGTGYCLARCPDWTQIAWGAPTYSPVGGATQTFTPASGAGDTMSAEFDIPDSSTDWGTFFNSGTITVPGYACCANAHIVFTWNLPGPVPPLAGGILISLPAPALSPTFNFTWTDPSQTIDLPITLPDKAGVPYAVTISFNAHSLQWLPGQTSGFHLTVKFTNI